MWLPQWGYRLGSTGLALALGLPTWEPRAVLWGHSSSPVEPMNKISWTQFCKALYPTQVLEWWQPLCYHPLQVAEREILSQSHWGKATKYSGFLIPRNSVRCRVVYDTGVRWTLLSEVSHYFRVFSAMPVYPFFLSSISLPFYPPSLL